jgi:hypothetical protein
VDHGAEPPSWRAGTAAVGTGAGPPDTDTEPDENHDGQAYAVDAGTAADNGSGENHAAADVAENGAAGEHGGTGAAGENGAAPGFGEEYAAGSGYAQFSPEGTRFGDEEGAAPGFGHDQGAARGFGHDQGAGPGFGEFPPEGHGFDAPASFQGSAPEGSASPGFDGPAAAGFDGPAAAGFDGPAAAGFGGPAVAGFGGQPEHGPAFENGQPGNYGGEYQGEYAGQYQGGFGAAPAGDQFGGGPAAGVAYGGQAGPGYAGPDVPAHPDYAAGPDYGEDVDYSRPGYSTGTDNGTATREQSAAFPGQYPPVEPPRSKMAASFRVPKRTKKSAKRGRPGRQAQLTVARVEPWSVMKFSFVISLVAFIILFVAVAVLYGVLSGLGVFSALQRTIQSITSSQGSSGFNLGTYLSASRVLSYTGLLGAINVVLITAMSTVGSVLYNISADLAGGVEVTLKETD